MSSRHRMNRLYYTLVWRYMQVFDRNMTHSTSLFTINFHEEILFWTRSSDQNNINCIRIRHIDRSFPLCFDCTVGAYRNILLVRPLRYVAILSTRDVTITRRVNRRSSEVQQADVDALSDRSFQTPRMRPRTARRHWSDVRKRKRSRNELLIVYNRYHARPTFLYNCIIINIFMCERFKKSECEQFIHVIILVESVPFHGLSVQRRVAKSAHGFWNSLHLHCSYFKYRRANN